MKNLYKTIEEFGTGIFHGSCIAMNGETVFRQLLDGKGYIVVEVGTRFGMSAAVLSEYCNHVYTFDIVKPKYPVIDFLGIENITQIVVDEKHIHREIAKIDFDFAFIDGNHAKDYPLRDFEAVKKCGRVLFHDIPSLAVRAVYEALPQEQMTFWKEESMGYWTNK